MKISVWIFATDLLQSKKTLIERLVRKASLFKNTKQEEVFARLKSSGVDGIELLIPANFSAADFQYLKKIFDENGIIVNSIHQPLRWITKTNFKEVEMLFSVANKFRARVIVLHLYNAKEQIFNSHYLNKLRELEKDYDIKISFENTQKSAQIFNKKRFWEGKTFAKIIRVSGFLITFDITHLANAGGDIIAFFKQNKEQIINIHLSDYKTKWSKRGLHLPLGKGSLPIKEFLNVLKENNYDGLITLEIKGNLEDLCDSARFIKQVV